MFKKICDLNHHIQSLDCSVKTNLRLKLVVNDINENWSLFLAYVDKLAKYNQEVRFLLIGADCLSHYEWNPWTPNVLSKQPKLSKNWSKTKQPKKAWIQKGSEFEGEFQTICTKPQIVKHNNTHSEKKSAVANGYFDHSKVLSTNTWSRILFGRSTHVWLS